MILMQVFIFNLLLKHCLIIKISILLIPKQANLKVAIILLLKVANCNSIDSYEIEAVQNTLNVV
ncbi:MAG: hypothetical protein DBX47_06445 [Clostridiales bacterium]|nr:MAG: hypothetical protein DBX47_06445 [Clostridiales bacterium]